MEEHKEHCLKHMTEEEIQFDLKHVKPIKGNTQDILRYLSTIPDEFFTVAEIIEKSKMVDERSETQQKKMSFKTWVGNKCKVLAAIGEYKDRPRLLYIATYLKTGEPVFRITPVGELQACGRRQSEDKT